METDPRLLDMYSRNKAFRTQQEQQAGQGQVGGAMSLPSELIPDQNQQLKFDNNWFNPRDPSSYEAMKSGQMLNASPDDMQRTADLSPEMIAREQEKRTQFRGGMDDQRAAVNMAGGVRPSPNMNASSVAQDQVAQNRLLQNKNAMMQTQAKQNMMPGNMNRQPMAPPIQQQAAAQSSFASQLAQAQPNKGWQANSSPVANAQPGNPNGTPATAPMAGQMNRQQMFQRRMGQRPGMQRARQTPAGQVANPNAMPKSVSSF